MPKPKQPTTWREWRRIDRDGVSWTALRRYEVDELEKRIQRLYVEVECRVVKPKPKRKGRGK